MPIRGPRGLDALDVTQRGQVAAPDVVVEACAADLLDVDLVGEARSDRFRRSEITVFRGVGGFQIL